MSALVCGSISASYCIQGAKDRCLLSLSVELSSFLALSLPSSLFLAALSLPSSLLLVVRQPSYCLLFLFSFIFSPTATRITTTSLRIGVFLVCLPSYCLFFSLSHPPISLLLVVCQPSYRLLSSLALFFLFDDDDDDDDHTKDSG